MAAISKGQRGGELTEMAELAAAGAAAFTDDGNPVVSAGLMRRALQYSVLANRPLALHCEDPALSRGGHAHEGTVTASSVSAAIRPSGKASWSRATSLSPRSKTGRSI